MDVESSESAAYPGSGNMQIPIDLFGSKEHHGLPRGTLAFADESGNIVYKVNRHNSSPKDKKLLLDASGNVIFSIHRYQKGSWKCYKGESNVETDMVLRVQRTVKKLNIVELQVFYGGNNGEACDLIMRGSPCMRSCGIYKDTEIVAQTSLMYKLHQIYASRGKFRITIFPGTTDRAVIVALFVIFLNGRK
ncbi:hypothetical protein HN51_050394 [Arachis hypogaea]|uniref:Protein LURP-one-related n=1 Tax=Arachis hypogaea TaxID=3818 RepID=A0A444YBI9_ARAHY|nr:protein LURP-one-related 7 [Arachis hypogaea]QHN92129.1 Protein LURP-one-related [Arachis hypogaea]RYQ99273.1 hypothetical protein Ahy_B07g087178 [Arachis hypogaea]